MSALAAIDSGLAPVEQLQERAREFIAASKAPNTVRAQRAGWAAFTTWCAARHLEALPAHPETVALYLADLAGVYKVGTIAQRLSAISVAHQAAGMESPTGDRRVRFTMRGIRRTYGTSQTRKAPIRTRDLRAMVAEMPDTTKGIRDRALLLIGFATAMRRSEVVSLDVADVAERTEGLVVTLRRSKTDQEAAGHDFGVPYGSNPATCPVRALRGWLDHAGIVEGPIFRPVDRHGNIAPRRLSGAAVAVIVKEHAEAAGLDPDAVSGHSLRAGFVTSAAEARVPEWCIQRTSRHRSIPVLRTYIRSAGLFDDNAATEVGL